MSFGTLLGGMLSVVRRHRLVLPADLAAINPFDFYVEDSAKDWPFRYESELAAELKPYLELTAGGPLLERYMTALAERCRKGKR